MNITKEEKGNLVAEIKIEITGDDYNESVNKVLKDYQRKAQMPGFRPGKVPFGMIKKMYGEAVKFDEINKLVSDSLTNYITENKLEILGQPLPSNKLEQSDFKEDRIEFRFETGLAPKYDLELNNDLVVEYIHPKVDDAAIEQELEATLKRFGTYDEVDESEDGDAVEVRFEELDAEGNIKKDGVVYESPFKNELLKYEGVKEKFASVKRNDTFDFAPLEAIKDEDEAAAMLGIDKENEGLGSTYKCTIVSIRRFKPAELNEELYNKVYPGSEVKTESDFKNRLSEEIQKVYDSNADRVFTKNTIDTLIKNANLELPDEFLKKWLVETNENLTREQVENEYASFSETIKWQIIENEIAKKHPIQVDQKDISDYFESHFVKSLGGHEMNDEQKESIKTMIQSLMGNKEQVKQVHDIIYEERLTKIFKENVNIEIKEVSYDEYMKLISEESAN